MAKIKKTEATNDIIEIFSASNSHKKKLLALNNKFSKETSTLTMEQLEEMANNAYCAIGIAPDVALLIAFDETSEYQNPNFEYFKTKFDKFIYIDRIIVNRNFQGQGIASNFYEEMLELAKETEHKIICCEIKIDPINDASIAFHENFGFKANEEKVLENGTSIVYYYFEI